MQPEDIIQQKKWYELSNAERLAVAPLATDESEFNLLKKMLQVTTADDVPQVSDAVVETIKVHLPAPAQKPFRAWYMAAAVLFAVALGLVFFLQQKKSDDMAAGPTSKATAPPSIPLPKLDSTATVRFPPSAVPEKPKATGNSRPSRAIANVNISVSANASLLAFVTEVY